MAVLIMRVAGNLSEAESSLPGCRSTHSKSMWSGELHLPKYGFLYWTRLVISINGSWGTFQGSVYSVILITYGGTGKRPRRLTQ